MLPTPEQVEQMMTEKMGALPQSLNSAKAAFDIFES